MSRAIRPRRQRLVAALLVLPLLAFIAVYALYGPGGGREPGVVVHVEHAASSTGAPHCRYRLLYYDPLWLEHPNRTLVKLVEEIVRRTGGCADIYLGGRAGLSPLLHLDRYDVVIIRAHGGIWDGKGFYFATGLTPLGPYDVPKRLVEKLVAAKALEVGSPAVLSGGAVVAAREYLVVGAPFFEKIARFKRNAIVVVESCDSLADPRFVQTVLRAGAGVYIGWTGKVTPSDIDATLPRLLRIVVEELGHPCRIARLVAERLVAASTGSVLEAVCRG